MSRKRFLFYLFSKNKKPFYKDVNGIILEGNSNYQKPDGQPAHIVFSPQGVNDMLVKYVRNIKYWGVFRDMTIPLMYVKDGSDILDYVFWTDRGMESICYSGMMKLDPLTVPYVYKTWYLSEINFSKYKKTKTGTTVECLEGGISKIFKAYETTDFEIDIDDDPQHVNVLFDGMNLIGRQTWVLGPFTYNGEPNGGFQIAFGSAQQAETEGRANGINFFDSLYGDESTFVSENYFLNADTNPGIINVSLKGSFKLLLKTKRASQFISIRVIKSPKATPNSGLIFYYMFSPANGVGTNFTTQGEIKDVAFDFTIPMNPDDRLFMDVRIQPSTFENTSDFEILDDGEMTCEFVNKYKSTYAKGLYAYRVFEKLVEKMIGSNFIISDDNIFKSTFLQSLKSCLILSGDSIRQLPGAKIKTNLSDFYKSMNHFGIGLGIEAQKLVIELFNEFFKSDVVIDLGEVADAELVIAEDLEFNTIITGGPVIEYRDVNGRYEPNQKQTWKTPRTRIIKELDLTTPYRRDPVGMELLRQNYTGKTTTDTESDNDNFMLNVDTVLYHDAVEDINYVKLNRPAYTTIEGVLDPVGIFNLEYSPKRTLLNNASQIGGLMDLLNSESIELSKAEKNRELKTIGGPFIGTVDEDEIIPISTLLNPFCRPHYFQFSTRVPINLLEIMEITPYSKIKFTVKGRTFYAFMFDGSIKPGDNDKQTWKVLSAPENDLSKFQK